MLQSIGIFTAAAIICFRRGAKFNWKISVPIRPEHQAKAIELFEKFEFYQHHPLFAGSKLISDLESNDREYEVKEKLMDLGCCKYVAANRGKFVKNSPNEFVFEINLGVCGKALTTFRMEFTITENEIIENAIFTGSYLMTKLTEVGGKKVHFKMLENLKRHLEESLLA
jgi:hypothetical protein